MLNKLNHFSKAFSHQLLFNPACTSIALTKYKNYKNYRTICINKLIFNPICCKNSPTKYKKLITYG